jgi:HAD superfamily hydrolase (TIGR01459 family)
MTAAIPSVSGVAALADRFDLFLVDQYGVLHDGERAFPGAVEALERLVAAGRAVILVSNSGRRTADNEARLAAIGFPRSSYHGFVSSGEVVWARIARGELPVAAAGRPLHCLLVNRRGDESAVAGLPLTLVETGSEADFVLITGSDGDRLPLQHYRALLAPAAERRLPCLCANPDTVMVLPDGTAYGAGRIAALYAALGGPVTWIGKPHPEIYRFALEEAARLRPLPPPERIIGIGDSLAHDVAGARRAGFAAALVTTGIHAGDTPAALAAAMAAHAAPNFLLDRFRW